MRYSLVNATLLGFDLVRLSAGSRVAGVLLVAMNADGELLQQLAATHPARGQTKAQRRQLAIRSRLARETAAGLTDLSRALRDVDAATLAHEGGDTLSRGMFGGVRALEELLESEILDGAHPAVAAVGDAIASRAREVLADAAVGWWAADTLPTATVAELTAPLEEALRLGPVRRSLSPLQPRVDGLLASLERLDDDGRRMWRAIADGSHGRANAWADAMHEAAWAAHLANRTTDVAAVLLLTVRAFREGGLTPDDAAAGVWNAVAGTVQGLLVADILDSASLEQLIQAEVLR